MSLSKRAGPRLNAVQRREQLLDATREIVAEASFHQVSIDSVARRAGVSRPVVYDHFNDLGGLLNALVARESASALRDLAEFMPAIDRSRPTRELLLAALNAYLQVVRATPMVWRLVLMPPEGAPEELRAGIIAGRRAVIATLAEVVASQDGEGSPDPELTARMLSAFADECARLILTDPEAHPRERLLTLAEWALARLLP